MSVKQLMVFRSPQMDMSEWKIYWKWITGKSEIVRVYMDNINALPTVYGSQRSKIHQFCQNLNYNVQSMETLGKVLDCWTMVQSVLDKLPSINAELVSNKMGWQDWGFGELLQASEEWREIYPLEMVQKKYISALTSSSCQNFSLARKRSTAANVCLLWLRDT